MTVAVENKSNSENDISIESDVHYIQKFADQMLSCREFKGNYSVRRLVEPLRGYRDVVEIKSTEDKKLLTDLMFVKKRLKEFYGDNVWVGITGPNSIGTPFGYCLWVNFENIPLGYHEFCIKKIHYKDNEICLELFSKRYIGDSSSLSSDRLSESSTTEENHNRSSTDNDNDVPQSMNELTLIFAKLLDNILTAISDFHCCFTYENFKIFFSFLFLLLATLFTFLMKALPGLAEFILRFMKEFSNLIKVCMPFLLAILDVIQKTIGGFYLLIAMVWRSWMSRGRDNFSPQLANQLTYNSTPNKGYYRQGSNRGTMNRNGYYTR